jgi:hypothetical protein
VSSRPKAATAASATARTWSKSVTSAGTVTTCPPAAVISSASDPSAVAVRAEATTRAPAAAKRLAASRPMPLEAPITTTT